MSATRGLSATARKVLKAAAQGQLFDLEAPAPAGKGPAVELWCDGASRGNPGPAGAGALLKDIDKGTVLARLSQPLGRATNNEAEYAALLLGLKEAQRLKAVRVSVFADSQLVIRQLKGEYRVKHPVMRERHQEAMRLLALFGAWSAEHVPREQNTEADRLANLALDAPA